MFTEKEAIVEIETKYEKKMQLQQKSTQPTIDRNYILTKDDKTALEQLLITTRKMLHTLSYLSISELHRLIYTSIMMR